MHDAMAFAILHGMADGKPWRNAGDIAFLCPVPGYDRHFAICAALGVRMIPVPLTGNGPDMDFVEAQVAADPAIKGMWCVPLYSNPTGEIYSADTIRRLASMPTAAPDFRLFWDDAYRFHHLTEQKHTTLNMIDACAAAGHPTGRWCSRRCPRSLLPGLRWRSLHRRGATLTGGSVARLSGPLDRTSSINSGTYGFCATGRHWSA